MSTLIWGGWGLPEAEADPQPEFAVLVEGHRILEAGTRQELRTRHPAAEIVGQREYVLLPAMVNSHDHGRAIGTLPLGVPDDPLEVWLPGLWSQPALDPYLAAAHDGLQLLRSGVGTVVHSHNPRDWSDLEAETEATLRGYRDAGIRVAYNVPILDQNPLVYGEQGAFVKGLPAEAQQAAAFFVHPGWPALPEYLGLCAGLWDRYHDHETHTVHIQISPCGGQWCSDAAILQSVEFARTRRTRVQMHLLETQYQKVYAERSWGNSFVRHLEDIGALGPWLTLAHMVWVEPDDLALLAEREVAIAHNPSSNLRLRSGMAPLTKMAQAGIRLGIGLDGQSLDDDQDYLRELRLAWTLANRPGMGSGTLSSRRIFDMGTSEGAKITLEGAPLGRLAAGELADLMLVDWAAVQGVWASPHVDRLDLFLRRASRKHVQQVMVNGHWVVRDGRLTTLQLSEVTAALREQLETGENPALAEAAAAARALAPHLKRYYARWDDPAPDPVWE